MISLLSRSRPPDGPTVVSTVQALDDVLSGQVHYLLSELERHSSKRAAVERLSRTLFHLVDVRQELRRLQDVVGLERDSNAAIDHLRPLARLLVTALSSEPDESVHERWVLGNALRAVLTAERRLTNETKGVAPDEVPRIVVPSDFLYGAWSSPFPAECMLVGAGRRTGLTTTLGYVFDVTGVASAAHVKADDAKLARALVSMGRAGCVLGAWFHSHPGSGRSATHPSRIDFDQYGEWMCHYPPELLCAIVVADGWIRFWGETFERGRMRIEVVGRGVRKEDERGGLYRLTEC